MPTDADVIPAVTLADIMRELVTIRRLVEDRRQPAPLSRADRDLLGRVLPAVGATFASEWFLVRELFASQTAAVRLVLAGLNARQVGRLLRRGEGQVIDGYVVQQGGSELNTHLWRVMQV